MVCDVSKMVNNILVLLFAYSPLSLSNPTHTPTSLFSYGIPGRQSLSNIGPAVIDATQCLWRC